MEDYIKTLGGGGGGVINSSFRYYAKFVPQKLFHRIF